MKLHTSAFKNDIKLLGKELDSKITYVLNNETITLGSEDLNSVTPHYESEILKSVMKQLDIDSNVEIPVGTILTYQFGLKINGEYEYISYGNYIVYSVEKQEDTGSYKIVCYDAMLNTMKKYTVLQNGVFPMTVRDFLSNICIDCNLVFKNNSDEFCNYDKIIEADPYENLNYLYRDIIDELAQVTASNICINEEDDSLEIRYITDTNDTIDEEYLKDINVNFGEKYGPINSIVLSRSAESDNVFLRDEESVAENGICEVKIKDNQIMNFNNRSDYLQGILNVLNGLEYYTNDFTSTGIMYYNLCDKYNISVGESIYSCVMFNDEANITQGLEEIINTPMPKGTKTDYNKADKTDRRINQAYIIVDKQNQEIEALTSSVQTISTTENNNYQELLGKFNEYMPITDFSELENSVRQLQTDTYTKTEIQQIARGIGVDGTVVEAVISEIGTFDDNGLTIEKTNAKTKGNFNEKGMRITDATGSTESELLFAGYDETLDETIVRTKNINVEKYLTIGKYSRIEDFIDDDNNEGTGIFFVGGVY